MVLVLDEVQKVARWSEIVKRLWDEDSLHSRDIRVVILGSSSLLVQAGLIESLAGRFELLHATHWSFNECEAYFKWNSDQSIYFGGYPGAAPLIEDENRWAQYLRDSLIETTLSKVKSGVIKKRPSCLVAFQRALPQARSLLVGRDGIAVEEFLQHPVSYWLAWLLK